MPEQLLDGLEGRAAFDKPGGEVVPKAVRGDIEYAGAGRGLLNDGVKALGLKWKDAGGRGDAMVFNVCPERFCKRRRQGDGSVLVTLASPYEKFAAGDITGA
jgi:hypothetical protein